MKRVALYVRVSTDEQKKHGLSVDNQIDALNQYCSDNGYLVYNLYNDAGISGRKSYKKRPALLRLIQDCKDGKIDLIIFTKLDRWFRSVADYYEVQSVLDECKVPWKCIWEDYETETSAGVFKVNIMLSVAQSEADRTSERIRNTFDYKKAKGEYVGGNKAPAGYMRTGTKYVINKDEEKAVRAFFDTYLATLNQRQAIEAAAHFGLHINTTISQRMLYHPAYYGALPYVEGTYITKEQHRIIEKAKKSTKVYTTGYQYIFSGLLRCKKCGHKMVACRTSRPRKDGSMSHVVRYVCKTHEARLGCEEGSSISEKCLEKYMIDSIEQEIANYSYNLSTAPSYIDNINQIKAYKSRLKRLRDLYELGDIDFVEYKNKRIEITKKIDSCEKNVSYEPAALSADWLDVYSRLDIEHKRAFWNQTVDHIEIDGMRCTTPKIFF